ncbi:MULTISPECIES: bactofilin family protein [Brenneria]|uniref:Polymer-forming cytoskeletal protein n=1 Tax=Brenneria nigrifluens DSM 30175 = ATCC 13028 TaxID=1121120 RepID=A0A2U1UIS0_9GAMM|nr:MULTISPECIES: polymer-forming cytoskeletal protein [Brenneria]PWC21569.1 polymer-forming cytoskeletal protein [Brenneria nigrifluens DSM 30175 = ATCC 13028]QCR06275.1 polymer-forming cytoskeletal protein [Brenneria nigrifluens DSM 30175 = ATCC 13028]
MFSFDKNKKSAAEPQERSALNSPTELVNSVSPVRVRKDAFISQGARMEGKLAADGDITVEGEIEGDVCCNNTIKVEHSGKVTGELTSQQIIINGRVEGRIYAGSVTILAQGKVVGDIFSDELSIEKGGVFTGKSNPLQAEQRAQEALACAEKADGPTENENVMALVENDPLA